MARPNGRGGTGADAGVAGYGVTAGEEGAGRGRITSIEGIPALPLDAISSGPEAMLATAGAGALARIEPITIAIVALLVIFIFSYRQVIAAFPGGGGCYAVSKANLGALLTGTTRDRPGVRRSSQGEGTSRRVGAGRGPTPARSSVMATATGGTGSAPEDQRAAYG